MKKVLALLLTMAMTVSLAACGGSSSTATSTDSTAASTDSTAASTDLTAASTDSTAASTDSTAASTDSTAASTDSTAASTDSTADTGSDKKDTADLKIALMLSGSANDGGWSQLAADAVNAMADKYGCQVNVSESLASTDYESTMRGYADGGYDIIVSHGAEFLDTAKLVSTDYPDLSFINTSALEGQEPNLAGVDFGSYQAGFIDGVACGLATKANKVGVIGAVEADTSAQWVAGVTDGAKYANPSCEVIPVYTGSFDDALKAKQSVKELAAQGCDTFTQNCDAAGTGAIQECDDEGLMDVGFVSDQSKEGESVFVSVLQDSGLGIEVAVDEAINGTLKPGAIEIAAADGVVAITDYTGKYKDMFTDEQKKKLQDVYDAAVAGKDLSTLS